MLFVKNNTSFFQSISDIAILSRRDESRLCTRRARKVCVRNSVFYMSSVIYNKIPKYINELDISQFEKKKCA